MTASLLGILCSPAYGEDEQDVYAAYDRLVVEALQLIDAERSQQPETAAARREVVVYFVSNLSVDRDIEIVVRDDEGVEQARLPVYGHMHSWQVPREAGRLPHVAATPLRFSVVVDGVQEAVAPAIHLGPGTGVLRVVLEGDASKGWSLRLTAWDLDHAPGFVQRVRHRILSQREMVTWLPLRDLTERPDMLLRMAECESGQDWIGVVRLYGMRHDPELANHPGYWERLTHCALDNGARDFASSALDKWFALAGDVLAIQRTALRFARLDQYRSDDARALAILSAIDDAPALGNAAEVEAVDVQAQILMARGDYERAVDVLRHGPHLRVNQIWEDDMLLTRSLDFLRLNHGIALLELHSVDEGRAMLDMVGRRRTENPMAVAARDLANVTLGRSLLKDRHGAEAAAVFDRVSLHGPFAEQALLGRGWATLIGPQARVPRSAVPGLSGNGLGAQPITALYRAGAISCHELHQLLQEDQDRCGGATDFERADLPQHTAELVRVAMNYWSELEARDFLSLVVIEGALAAADAHAALGDVEAARAALEHLQERVNYTTERVHLFERLAETDAAALINQVLLTDDMAIPKGGVASELAYFLRHWITDNRVSELVATLRRVSSLAAYLRDVDNETPEAASTHNRMLSLEGRIRGALEQKMQHALRQEADPLSRMREAVLLELARAHDRY